MPQQLTKEEVQRDFDNTISDVMALQAITINLSKFITVCGDEDRSAFRMDLFKYQGLLARAERLQDKISNVLEQFN